MLPGISPMLLARAAAGGPFIDTFDATASFDSGRPGWAVQLSAGGNPFSFSGGKLNYATLTFGERRVLHDVGETSMRMTITDLVMPIYEETHPEHGDSSGRQIWWEMAYADESNKLSVRMGSWKFGQLVELLKNGVWIGLIALGNGDWSGDWVFEYDHADGEFRTWHNGVALTTIEVGTFSPGTKCGFYLAATLPHTGPLMETFQAEAL